MEADFSAVSFGFVPSVLRDLGVLTVLQVSIVLALLAGHIYVRGTLFCVSPNLG